MDEREQLVQQLVEIISGYREGRIFTRIDGAHVETWLSQFPLMAQLDILREITFTLSRTYFSRERIVSEIRRMFGFQEQHGPLWRNVSMLNIQGGGNSQYDMIQIISDMVRQTYGFELQVNAQVGTYIYFDDGIFTGKRVEQDIESWIRGWAPNNAVVHIAAIYTHAYGKYNVSGYLDEVARSSGKNISIRWRENIYIEDRRAYTYSSDVLRPTHAPTDVNVQAYIENMRRAPVYRQPGNAGRLGYFSSCHGRSILEQEFLTAGVRIKQMCPHLNLRQRPLGNSALDTLGFGSMIVTYRNCPNNAPLALWVGAPWYPLFPRMTNADALNLRLLNGF